MRGLYLLLALLFASQQGVCQHTYREPTERPPIANSTEKEALVSFPGLHSVKHVEVQHGVVPLVIHYSPLLDPESVVVKLNGKDISELFNPETGREIIQLELESGANALEVQAKPQEADGRTQLHQLTLVRSDEPHSRHQGRMSHGEVRKSDTKESMEALFRRLRENRSGGDEQ